VAALLTAQVDSALVIDETIVAADPEAVAEWLLSRSSSSRRRGAWLTADIVAGQRQAAGVRTGWGVLRAGARRTHTTAGYAGIFDAGVIERLIVGGVRMRAGEGLVMGRSPSVYSTPRSGLPTLSVGESMSTWRPRSGGAVSLRRGRYRMAGAAWRDEGDVMWAGMERRAANGTIGLSGGQVSDGVVAARAVSAFGALVSGGSVVSAEMALWNGELCALIRGVTGAWGVEVSNGLAGGGLGDVTISPVERRRRRRAVIHTRARFGDVKMRVAVFGIREQGIDGTKHRRRVEVQAIRDMPAGRFRVDVRYAEDGEVDLAREDAITNSVWDTGRLLRVRARFETPAGLSVGQRLSVTWIEPFTGGERGMVAGWQGVVRSRFHEVRVSVHAFAAPRGTLGYVSRPGVTTT